MAGSEAPTKTIAAKPAGLPEDVCTYKNKMLTCGKDYVLDMGLFFPRQNITANEPFKLPEKYGEDVMKITLWEVETMAYAESLPDDIEKVKEKEEEMKEKAKGIYTLYLDLERYTINENTTKESLKRDECDRLNFDWMRRNPGAGKPMIEKCLAIDPADEELANLLEEISSSE